MVNNLHNKNLQGLINFLGINSNLYKINKILNHQFKIHTIT
jgi:hypothetical protein